MAKKKQIPLTIDVGVYRYNGPKSPITSMTFQLDPLTIKELGCSLTLCRFVPKGKLPRQVFMFPQGPRSITLQWEPEDNVIKLTDERIFQDVAHTLLQMYDTQVKCNYVCFVEQPSGKTLWKNW